MQFFSLDLLSLLISMKIFERNINAPFFFSPIVNVVVVLLCLKLANLAKAKAKSLQ